MSKTISTIRVVDENNNTTIWSIAHTTPFQVYMVDYCMGCSLDFATTKFMYNGVPLRADQTPADLDIHRKKNVRFNVVKQ